MPLNSKAKGKAGELELAALLRKHGFAAQRGVQYKGGGDSPDVAGLDGFHIECKRVETFNLYAALDQANRDKKPEDQALVFHRRNRRDWVVVMDADEFLALLTKYVFEEARDAQ